MHFVEMDSKVCYFHVYMLTIVIIEKPRVQCIQGNVL